MKRLIPGFLKRIDHYLLLNHPIIWISKIHYVLFYGVITTILSTISGLVIPLNLSHPQDLALWYFLFTILAIIALCFWIYHNVIFNLEKKFGKRKWFDEYKLFSLNFFCVFVFISFPIAFTAIYNARVANVVSDAEFANDINTLNKGEAYAMNDINNYESHYDSIKGENYYDLKKCILFDPYTPWKLRYDTLEVTTILTYNELKKIYDASSKNNAQIKLQIKNYLLVFKKYGLYKQPEALEDTLFKRYKRLTALEPISNAEFFSGYTSGSYYEMEQIINNISEAKFIPLFIWRAEFLNFLLYTCLYISLLVMLFKMVPWKQYLVTFISLIIIPIILFIISQLIPYTSYIYKDILYLLLIALTLLVALIFTLTGISPSKQFNAFKNICGQITYLTLPVFPIIVLSLFKNVFFNLTGQYEYSDNIDTGGAITSNYNNTWQYIYLQLERAYWQKLFDTCFMLTVYGSIFFFIIVIIPLMKQLFVKQLALPHKN